MDKAAQVIVRDFEIVLRALGRLNPQMLSSGAYVNALNTMDDTTRSIYDAADRRPTDLITFCAWGAVLAHRGTKGRIKPDDFREMIRRGDNLRDLHHHVYFVVVNANENFCGGGNTQADQRARYNHVVKRIKREIERIKRGR